MKTTYPLPLDADMHAAVHKVARKIGLSQADVIRHSLRLGLPELVTRLSPSTRSRKRPLAEHFAGLRGLELSACRHPLKPRL